MEAVNFFSLNLSFWETCGNRLMAVPCMLSSQRLNTKVSEKRYPAQRNREYLTQVPQRSGQHQYSKAGLKFRTECTEMLRRPSPCLHFT